jgi:hypothetical protein
VHSAMVECPVCLEEYGHDRDIMVIMRCGHYVCMSCALKINRITDSVGNLNYLLPWRNSQCPMCRYRNPFNKIITWPNPESVDTYINGR